MFKFKAKKVICVIMSVILLAACVVPAFAETGDSDVNPILIVSGFSEYDLVNYDTGETVFVPSSDAITKTVTDALPSLTKLLASDKTKADYDKFCDDFIPVINNLFDPIACNPDGEVKHDNVGLVNQFTESVAYYGIDTVTATEVFDKQIVNTACYAVGEENVYVYGLDWRVDPLVIADDINAYVQHMKEVTGCAKVSISGISMGGVALSAYLAKYGTEDLSNITMISSAFTGLEMVGCLFTGQVSIDEQGLYQIITESIGNKAVSDVLEKTGFLKKLIPVIEELFEVEADRIYTECLIPNFGYNTGIWAFVPDEYFASAKKFMNTRMNEGTKVERDLFWNRVNTYHNYVQNSIKDILVTAKQNGVNVAVISNYNSQMSPITPKSNCTGDQVIETMHTSGYATVANHGSTLGDNYPRNKYLSQDRMIDASTCYLPDNTWFIKNQKHVEFSESSKRDNGAFYAWILTAKSQYTIDTNAKYPQFMIYDRDAKVLSPLASITGDASGDGKVSILDAKLVLQFNSGAVSLTAEQQWAADINCDGKVSIVDAKLLLDKISNEA